MPMIYGTIFFLSGSPCNNYAGYCDFLNKCRKVDAEGPLSRLKNLFFSSESIDNILDWMKSYWWACVLIGLGLILFMAGMLFILSSYHSILCSRQRELVTALQKSPPINQEIDIIRKFQAENDASAHLIPHNVHLSYLNEMKPFLCLIL